MSTRAIGTIENTSFSETPLAELDGTGKLARGSMTEIFHGGIEGEGIAESLLAYRADGSTTLVGFERVVGRLGERSGSFVLQYSGSLANGTGQAAWFVLPGSATGDLSGLAGQGGYTWDGKTQSYTLDYDFS